MSRRGAAMASLTLAQPTEMVIEAHQETRLGKIPVERIVRNPGQPRTQFDQAGLLDLASSLVRHGQLQPVRVQAPDADGNYMLIDGERRWRALQLAGIEAAEAVIEYNLGDQAERKAFEQALVANLHREDLSRHDQAQAVGEYKRYFSLTNDEVAERLNRSLSWVDGLVAFAALAPETQELMDTHGLATQLAKSVRALGPADQRLLVEKLRDLPNRAHQLEMTRLVKDLTREGSTSVGEAIATSSSLLDQRRDAVDAGVDDGEGGHDAGATSSRGPRTRGNADAGQGRPIGRPRRFTAPFTIEEIAGVGFMRVKPAGLSVPRLLSSSEVPHAVYLEALVKDLIAYRDACAGSLDGATLWQELLDAVRHILDDGAVGA
jgi:ParB/RepB/Spo0J family partition protein